VVAGDEAISQYPLIPENRRSRKRSKGTTKGAKNTKARDARRVIPEIPGD
jgi:hypothetical protein